MMNVIFIGPPGAGKGTQAQSISKEFKIPHISTGEMLRSQMESGTKLGNQVKEIVTSGKLVDDTLMNEIVARRLSDNDAQNGFILDGFPRTLNQAEALDKILEAMKKKVEYVFYIEVPENVIIDRLSARRVCPRCGRNYNMITDPPKEDETCDICHVHLVTRDDDKPATIKKRYELYLSLTEPLIEYYKGKGVLFTIDGTLTVDEIKKSIINDRLRGGR